MKSKGLLHPPAVIPPNRIEWDWNVAIPVNYLLRMLLGRLRLLLCLTTCVSEGDDSITVDGTADNDGGYVHGGDEGDRPTYYLESDAGTTLTYNGDAWVINSDHEPVTAEEGDELFPWLAEWPEGVTVVSNGGLEGPSAVTVTVGTSIEELRAVDTLSKFVRVINLGPGVVTVSESGFIIAILASGEGRILPHVARLKLEAVATVESEVICATARRCPCGTVSDITTSDPPIVYENTEQRATASCPDNTQGEPVEAVIEAGTITSEISVADANEQALALAQGQAAQDLECIPIFTSTRSATASCPYGQTGDSVTRTATRTSLVSQEDADDLAMEAAQEAADADLECSPLEFTSTQEYTANCAASYPGTSGDSVTRTYTVTSNVSQEAADAEALVNAQEWAEADLVCCGNGPFNVSFYFVFDEGDVGEAQFPFAGTVSQGGHNGYGCGYTGTATGSFDGGVTPTVYDITISRLGAGTGGWIMDISGDDWELTNGANNPVGVYAGPPYSGPNGIRNVEVT